MTPPMMPSGTRLKDKVILVTGSGTGIGEGMARRFISEGARVMLHDKGEDALPALASELGENASYVIGDLEDPAIPARLIEQTVAHFGRIDGLVNNAAVKTRGGIENTDEQAFDRTVNVNLKAPFFLIRAAIPHFRKQGGGRVLNIGSINAYCGEVNQCIYSACKGALMTLTRNLADAHGAEGIRVNQIDPGWTLTPNELALKATEGLTEDWPSRLANGVRARRPPLLAGRRRIGRGVPALRRSCAAERRGSRPGAVSHDRAQSAQGDALVKPRLAAFPKCFMDQICVHHTMTLFEWIELAATLGVDGLEFYSGFLHDDPMASFTRKSRTRSSDIASRCPCSAVLPISRSPIRSSSPRKLNAKKE